MNKIFKYGAMAVAGLLSMVLGSCTEEYEYDPASIAGQQVYFSNTLAEKVELDKTASSFTVPVNRVKTDDEVTVNLIVTDESGLFTVPTSVTFAEGESEKTITIGYDAANFEYDDFKDVTISIAEVDYTTPYGASSYVFSAGVPAPYISLGVGKFYDNYLIDGYAEVEIMQNMENPNMFRVMKPYDEFAQVFQNAGYNVPGGQAEYIEFTVMQPGNTLAGVKITEKDLVYFSPASIGIDIFGLQYAAWIFHPANVLKPAEETWLHSRVAAWQDNALPGIVNLAPVYMVPETGQGSTSNVTNDGVVQIVFPGYVQTDYSAKVAYTGTFISKEEVSYAMGSVTLGADVEEAQVAVVEGDNAEDALNAVLGGTVETVTITESGEVKIPCTYSGKCTMIAVAFAGGEPQDYGYATFTFNTGSSEWKALGTGLYTDNVFVLNLVDESDNQAPPVTYPVEVQESTKTPGVYRLLHPYAPGTYGYEGDFGYDVSGDYNLIINAADKDAVYIEPQSTGFIDSEAGDFMITSLGGINLYLGAGFDELKENGYFRMACRNGRIDAEPKGLLYTFSSLLSEGRAAYVNETSSAEVLVLPSAVSAKSLSKAVKAKGERARIRMTKTLKTGNMGFDKREVAFKLVKNLGAARKVELK